MAEIEEILPRRSDLSTFLVHLTRSGNGSAKDILCKILIEGRLSARSPFGHAFADMKKAGWDLADQMCVCFTEVPLEYICLLAEPIKGRSVVMEPYGIAITKKQGRRKDANPVWYIDQTIGRTWLTNPLNQIVREAIDGKNPGHPIFRITPFIEQFGEYKDFHWEREWRCIGDFRLPKHFMIIAPESDHADIKKVVSEKGSMDPSNIRFIDAHWGLEKCIARLAGFDPADL